MTGEYKSYQSQFTALGQCILRLRAAVVLHLHIRSTQSIARSYMSQYHTDGVQGYILEGVMNGTTTSEGADVVPWCTYLTKYHQQKERQQDASSNPASYTLFDLISTSSPLTVEQDSILTCATLCSLYQQYDTHWDELLYGTIPSSTTITSSHIEGVVEGSTATLTERCHAYLIFLYSHVSTGIHIPYWRYQCYETIIPLRSYLCSANSTISGITDGINVDEDIHMLTLILQCGIKSVSDHSVLCILQEALSPTTANIVTTSASSGVDTKNAVLEENDSTIIVNNDTNMLWSYLYIIARYHPQILDRTIQSTQAQALSSTFAFSVHGCDLSAWYGNVFSTYPTVVSSTMRYAVLLRTLHTLIHTSNRASSSFSVSYSDTWEVSILRVLCAVLGIVTNTVLNALERDTMREYDATDPQDYHEYMNEPYEACCKYDTIATAHHHTSTASASTCTTPLSEELRQGLLPSSNKPIVSYTHGVLTLLLLYPEQEYEVYNTVLHESIRLFTKLLIDSVYHNKECQRDIVLTQLQGNQRNIHTTMRIDVVQRIHKVLRTNHMLTRILLHSLRQQPNLCQQQKHLSEYAALYSILSEILIIPNTCYHTDLLQVYGTLLIVLQDNIYVLNNADVTTSNDNNIAISEVLSILQQCYLNMEKECSIVSTHRWRQYCRTLLNYLHTNCTNAVMIEKVCEEVLQQCLEYRSWSSNDELTHVEYEILCEVLTCFLQHYSMNLSSSSSSEFVFWMVKYILQHIHNVVTSTVSSSSSGSNTTARRRYVQYHATTRIWRVRITVLLHSILLRTTTTSDGNGNSSITECRAMLLDYITHVWYNALQDEDGRARCALAYALRYILSAYSTANEEEGGGDILSIVQDTILPYLLPRNKPPSPNDNNGDDRKQQQYCFTDTRTLYILSTYHPRKYLPCLFQYLSYTYNDTSNRECEYGAFLLLGTSLLRNLAWCWGYGTTKELLESSVLVQEAYLELHNPTLTEHISTNRTSFSAAHRDHNHIYNMEYLETIPWYLCADEVFQRMVRIGYATAILFNLHNHNNSSNSISSNIMSLSEPDATDIIDDSNDDDEEEEKKEEGKCLFDIPSMYHSILPIYYAHVVRILLPMLLLLAVSYPHTSKDQLFVESLTVITRILTRQDHPTPRHLTRVVLRQIQHLIAACVLVPNKSRHRDAKSVRITSDKSAADDDICDTAIAIVLELLRSGGKKGYRCSIDDVLLCMLNRHMFALHPSPTNSSSVSTIPSGTIGCSYANIIPRIRRVFHPDAIKSSNNGIDLVLSSLQVSALEYILQARHICEYSAIWRTGTQIKCMQGMEFVLMEIVLPLYTKVKNQLEYPELNEEWIGVYTYAVLHIRHMLQKTRYAKYRVELLRILSLILHALPMQDDVLVHDVILMLLQWHRFGQLEVWMAWKSDDHPRLDHSMQARNKEKQYWDKLMNTTSKQLGEEDVQCAKDMMVLCYNMLDIILQKARTVRVYQSLFPYVKYLEGHAEFHENSNDLLLEIDRDHDWTTRLKHEDTRFIIRPLLRVIETRLSDHDSPWTLEDYMHEVNQYIDRYFFQEFNEINSSDEGRTKCVSYQEGIQISLEYLANEMQRKRRQLFDILEDDSKHLLLHDFLKRLSILSEPRHGPALRSAVSRCLGCFGSIDLTILSQSVHMKPPSSSHVSEDPLCSLKIEVLSVLVRKMCHWKTEHAMTALETIKAILSHENGRRCLERMPSSNLCKRLLLPFVHTSDKVTNPPTINDEFMYNIFAIIGITPEQAANDSSWCWEDKLWDCQNGGKISFKIWIKNLCVAMIHCCYVMNYSEESICGNDEFFTQCMAACSIDDELAVILFPGIIFDLLRNEMDTTSDDDEEALAWPSNTRKRKLSVMDSYLDKKENLGMTQFDNNITNNTISRCFRKHLIKDNYDEKEILSEHTIKSSMLALDTIELLRKESLVQFITLQRHKRNVADESTSAPLWKGAPFGIVLHLDGLQVLATCLKTQRFHSAMYYSELMADNIFRGSGDCLARLTKDLVDFRTRAKKDINPRDLSGFINKNYNTLEGMDRTSMILKFIEYMRLSYLNVKEVDVMKGISLYDPILRYTQRNQVHSASRSLDILGSPNDFQTLVSTDMLLQSPLANIISLPACRATVQKLDKAGMHHILSNYLAGISNIFTDLTNVPADFMKTLVESSFHCSWRAYQWDEVILKGDESDPLTLTQQGVDSTQDIRLCRHTLASGYDFLKNINPTDKRFPGFHETVTKLYDSILGRHAVNFENFISRGRYSLLNDAYSELRGELMLENMTQFSAQFGILNEIEYVSKLVFADDSKQNIENLWQTYISEMSHNQSACLKSSFYWNEMLLSSREVLMKLLSTKFDNCHNMIESHLWSYIEYCCSSSKPNMAEKGLNRLKDLLKRNEAEESLVWSKLMLKEADILKCRGNNISSMETAKLSCQIINTRSDSNGDKALMLSKSLLFCGEMMAIANVESAKSILGEYLHPAVQKVMSVYEKNKTCTSQVSESHLVLGTFVCNLYKVAANRVASSEWKEEKDNLQAKKIEKKQAEDMISDFRLKDSKRRKSSSKGSTESSTTAADKVKEYELRRHIRELDCEIKADTYERNIIQNSIGEYLKLGMQSLIKALEFSNVDDLKDDAAVFKLVSLWFDCSRSRDLAPIANETMVNAAELVPSFRFVPLTYQIFARIDDSFNSSQDSSDDSSFQQTLKVMVKRISLDHPYHSLVQLIALANGNKVGKGNYSANYLKNIGTSKVKAVSEILHELKMGEGYVSNLVISYETLVSSYIDLAMYSTKDLLQKSKPRIKGFPLSIAFSRGSKNNSPDDCIRRLLKSNYPVPCVLTKPPMVQPSCDYGGGTTDPIGSELIASISSTFDVTESGLHRPKIIFCNGARGGRYKQLVKGDDDIRQDAVMEQVFLTVNKLLFRRSSQQKNHISSEDFTINSISRMLRISTYNIIPLSPASGVLEWVDDTAPFGDFLSEKKTSIGAHSRYFPGEWSSLTCRKLLQEVTGQGKATKRKVFDKICENFSPAFRYFFVEKFSHDIQAWHCKCLTIFLQESIIR